jgi:SAM-dependent methyltransferase
MATMAATWLKQRMPPPVRAALRRARAALRRRASRRPQRERQAPWPLEDRTLKATPSESGLVTDALFARLAERDVAAIQAALSPDEMRLVTDHAGLDRRRLLLAFAVHHEVGEAMSKTGLSSATPPDDVHAMGRGALAAGGTTYYADLVAQGAERGGQTLSPGTRALDFGCSSGRVVRVLRAAFPEVEWHACDPNPHSIEWARANLRGIHFMVSPQEPPLPWPAGQFDFVFAISIWSHYSAPAGLRWLAEMRRVLGPGGVLLITTLGLESVAHARSVGQRSDEQLTEVLEALYRDGHWYKPEFGEHGDHGVASPDWGGAFLNSEWLLAHATPHWRIEHFAPGVVEGDQDLYVLSRR